MPRRRAARDHVHLLSVSVVLVVWAALYLVVWGVCSSEIWGELPAAWLAADRAPLSIAASCTVFLAALLVSNAAAFLDAANRTRAGAALAAVNTALALTLLTQLALHSLFVTQLSAHRQTGARSEGILAREVVGPWEVVGRSGSPPADLAGDSLELSLDGEVRARSGREWRVLEAAWHVEGSDEFRPRLPFCGSILARWCEREVFYAHEFRVGQPYSPPALVVNGAWEWRPADGRHYAWFADLSAPSRDEIVLRAATFGEPPLDLGALLLRRAMPPSKPAAGWDFAADLAPLRDVYGR